MRILDLTDEEFIEQCDDLLADIPVSVRREVKERVSRMPPEDLVDPDDMGCDDD